eukprot:TRINITY_DN5858_c0_g2_i1.p1 TRINITY_DN5858_c0_g2~~TRINITY_DN5858_c0_g2_i1.p1  ORF type:complete len:216 (+),score=61.28 TRINITY_DN5858_c0_g2_i1:66-650(+)
MGKGSFKGTVSKPWLKKSTTTIITTTKGKGGKSGKGSSSKGGGSWVFVPDSKSAKGASKGGSKGKGKGKGKRAPGMNSPVWQRKLDEENRSELGNKTYSGTIAKYYWKFGWGFITPDNFNGLPKKVKEAVEAATQEAIEKAAANGKDADENHYIYFRKPDINHQEGFKIAPDTAVTFSLYMDEKGAGAKDVSPA